MGTTARLIVTLTITCMISAWALAAINSLTEQPIAEQKQLAIQKAVEEVLPLFDNAPVEATRQIVLDDDERGADKELTVYLGSKEGQITGVALRTYGEGYGGLINVMVGITVQDEISGIKILTHQETPGLGSKIEEASFRDQFKNKSLGNSKLVGGNLAVAKDGGDIDALTGATISPRGVAQAASAGLKIFARHRAEILGRDGESAPDTSAIVPAEADTTAEPSQPEE